MSFQDQKIMEKPDHYIDKAFNRAKTRTALFRSRIKGKKFDRGKIEKSKTIEISRLNCIKDTLISDLDNHLKEFPSIDSLTPFYNNLIKYTLDYVRLKKSLASLNWLIKKIIEFTKVYSIKIKKTQEIEKINQYRREYYGRISSLFKKITPDLDYIRNSQITIKKFPIVKEMFTISIFGFPNIGKTTLLSKLTESFPDIQPYAFTTKRLNIGYFRISTEKIQLIDTPGTLNRFDKMNSIEKQADLALKHCSNMIIYIFDITEPYPLKDQQKLFNSIKQIDKPILIYLSKNDIVESTKDKNQKESLTKQRDNLIKKYKKFHPVTDTESLIKNIIKLKPKNTILTGINK